MNNNNHKNNQSNKQLKHNQIQLFKNLHQQNTTKMNQIMKVTTMPK